MCHPPENTHSEWKKQLQSATILYLREESQLEESIRELSRQMGISRPTIYRRAWKVLTCYLALNSGLSIVCGCVAEQKPQATKHHEQGNSPGWGDSTATSWQRCDVFRGFFWQRCFG